MFGRKSKWEMEQEIWKLKHERDMLQKDLENAVRKFDEYTKKMEDRPLKCQRGPWCDACRFNACIHIPCAYDRMTLNKIYYCAKGESCEHFLAKEGVTND